MRVDQARGFEELEKENGRLKRLVADLILDNAILKQVLREKFLSPLRRRKAVTVEMWCNPQQQVGERCK
jgi:hypothetical protein